ncbi:tripartite tricarboxylate transporter TctB family protein [Pelagibius sp. Alg239-R121]|uniref:tripartite tricarboxylate transporter TctB family protein n=1 Tax=Pelagibius sp. Alg239-R121 TaxID=2993448 RepID=UPI0024A71C49|nr:tripartite tricarboxylate transporter TctB family protein [Pelagibius sp. Alg239-R121]
MRAILEGIVLAVLSIAALWGAWQVPSASTGETWAGIVPFGAALGLLIISGLKLACVRRPATERAADSPIADDASLQVIGLFLLAVIYQQSLQWFGYLLPTALVAPVALYAFGVRSWIGLALSAVLCPLIFHIVFFELLGVFPPFGEVFDLLDAIRE